MHQKKNPDIKIVPVGFSGLQDAFDKDRVCRTKAKRSRSASLSNVHAGQNARIDKLVEGKDGPEQPRRHKRKFNI